MRKKHYLCKLNISNMNRFSTTLVRIYRYIKELKYVIAVVLGIVFVGFADDNSIWSHYQNRRHIRALQTEISTYNYRDQHDRKQIRALEKNPNAVEKIARERYFMKKDNEDIFVLSDDERTSDN